MNSSPMTSHFEALSTAKLEAQNQTLSRARHEYLMKEAERKYFEASAIKEAEGKSSAEKTINGQATENWLRFHKELAKLESIYEFEKLKYEILEKDWQREYLMLKIDSSIIGKQVT